jgi:cholesterol transport system auxiliary component
VRGGSSIGVAAAALLGISSCTGSLFQSKTPPVSMYRLSPPPAPDGAVVGSGPAAADPAADLAVLRPTARPGLQSDRIAVLYPDRHLDYFADARWSGPLEQVVQDLAVQVFRADASLRNVSADSSPFTSGYWLELEVLDFQAEYAGTSAPIVHVRLLARLGSARDRHVIGSFEAQVREPAAQNRLSAIVAAYEKAADEALRELALQTSAMVGSAPRP